MLSPAYVYHWKIFDPDIDIHDYSSSKYLMWNGRQNQIRRILVSEIFSLDA